MNPEQAAFEMDRDEFEEFVSSLEARRNVRELA